MSFSLKYELRDHFFEISQIIGMQKNETLSNRHLVTYYRLLKINERFEK